MKKAVLISFLVVMVMMFSSLVMAKSNPTLEAPLWHNSTPPCANVTGTTVDFAWYPVDNATKYSIDVEIPVALDMIVELEFSAPISACVDDGTGTVVCTLSVPLTDFVYFNGESYVPLSGTATAKVKGLNPPGKGSASQNNPFSSTIPANTCTFILPSL